MYINIIVIIITTIITIIMRVMTTIAIITTLITVTTIVITVMMIFFAGAAVEFTEARPCYRRSSKHSITREASFSESAFRGFRSLHWLGCC